MVFIDEAGLLTTPLLKRTWAPCAQTPELLALSSRTKISVIGALALTPHGRGIRFLFRLHAKKNVGAVECRQFLSQLLLGIPGNITVVLDNLMAHRARIVKNMVQRHKRLSLAYLPPYAPELNPVETVWSFVKYHQMANYTPRNIDELHGKSRTVLRKLKWNGKLLSKLASNSELVRTLRH